jgi:LPS export ABC transporter protein LptC
MILERFLCKTHRLQGITTIVWIVVMLLLCNTSCNKEKKEVVDVSFDPETTYTLRTTDVSTLISDSGITRYRLNAKEWLVFGKAKEPYWYFPKGIYVEKFDTLFQSEASIQADTAYNYEKKSLWKLVGNVKIESLEGTRFETSLLYWDQKEEKIYSDKYIRIEEEDKVITGIGFESNQDMSQYKIFDSQGVFPVSESVNDTISETVSLDSVTVQKEEFVPEYKSDVEQEIVKKNERKLVPRILKPLEKEIR